MTSLHEIKESFFKVILRSWWVVVFLLFSYVTYSQLITEKNLELEELKCRCYQLDLKKKMEIKTQENLLARVEAQKDPAFIELLLMEELGVVPDGQMKVCFRKKDSS